MSGKAVAVFLDANAIIYALDATSELHGHAVSVIQGLLDQGATLVTSHHVIEEVLYVVQKITGGETSATQVVHEIGGLPDLVLIEPAANLEFAERYTELSQETGLGVNDALILQLVLDAGISTLFTYDKKLAKEALALGIIPA